MKPYLALPLALMLGCSSIKNETTAQTDHKLLKDVEILSSDAYEGRKTGTKGAELSRAYLSKRFEEIGLKPISALGGYEQLFSFNNSAGEKVYGKNMLAYIPGKSEEIIVISAHYDHIGVINNEVYNGADDNASGVAGLLKIAAHFKKQQPNHGIIIAAFDAEEMGLRGSKAFIADPAIPLTKIRLNINMDMISHNDKNEVYACGTFKNPGLKKYFIFNNNRIKVLFGHDDPASGHEDWTSQSDQGSFNAVNIPFIYFGVEDHKDYHKSTDEYENINKTFFNDAVSAILQVTSNIDKERDIQQIFREKLQMKKQ